MLSTFEAQLLGAAGRVKINNRKGSSHERAVRVSYHADRPLASTAPAVMHFILVPNVGQLVVRTDESDQYP